MLQCGNAKNWKHVEHCERNERIERGMKLQEDGTLSATFATTHPCRQCFPYFLRDHIQSGRRPNITHRCQNLCGHVRHSRRCPHSPTKPHQRQATNKNQTVGGNFQLSVRLAAQTCTNPRRSSPNGGVAYPL